MVSCRSVSGARRELAVLMPIQLMAHHREIGAQQGSRARSGRRPASGILVSAITVMVMTFALTLSSGTVASASARATSPQKAGLAELMKSYHPRSGLIGQSWWQAAVALSTLETYQQTTGDTGYSKAISAAFKDHKSGHFESTYNDDTGWWALVWLQEYDITHVSAYLDLAETDANFIQHFK